MSSILLSIKPEFVEKILSGQKKYEFRKNACKRNIEKIYIYSTVPVQKVVGEAEVEYVLEKSPNELWNITKDLAGIDKAFFDSYYAESEKAVAYKLINVVKYDTPIMLSDLGVKVAPQSYQYI